MINPTPQNRKALREHAREAMAEYTPLMGWLLLDDEGDLCNIWEAQGQTEYVGKDKVIGTSGSVYAAHGQGGAFDDATGKPFKTQVAYLMSLLGATEYARVFDCTRVRKTFDEWEIQGYTECSWEMLTTETNWKDTRENLKIYRKECPETRYRVVKKRVRKLQLGVAS